MCVLDLEPCEVWTETEHTARTPKKCDGCGGSMAAGDRYVKHFSKYDGLIASEYLCMPCKADRAEFADAHGITPTPDGFWQILADCVSEDEDEENNPWKPMLDRLRARNRAAKSQGAVALPLTGERG